MPGAAYLERLLRSRQRAIDSIAARCDDRQEQVARNGGIAAREIDVAIGEDKAVNDEASMPTNEFNWGDRRQGDSVQVV